jgi:WD repeat-containing protein 68
MSVEPSREIYNYKAPWNIYGLSWSNRPKSFRLGLSSFIQDYCNKLVVVEMFNDSLIKVAEADHHFPITKLKWSPFKGAGPELLATTGDMLRLWEMVDADDAAPSAGENRKSLNYELRKTSTLCNVRKTVSFFN